MAARRRSHPPRRVDVGRARSRLRHHDWDWDFFNDGSFDDSGQQVDWQIDTPGQYQVKLRVHSTSGLTDTVDAQHRRRQRAACPRDRHPRRRADPDPPCWSVGDTINVSGTATDAEDGTLTGRALRLGRDHPPLPGGLPYPHAPDQVGHEGVVVRRARSRVPVLARGPSHRHRQHGTSASTSRRAAAQDLDARTSRRRPWACRCRPATTPTPRPGRRRSSGRGRRASAARWPARSVASGTGSAPGTTRTGACATSPSARTRASRRRTSAMPRTAARR